jgi:hypothetical protein
MLDRYKSRKQQQRFLKGKTAMKAKIRRIENNKRRKAA